LPPFYLEKMLADFAPFIDLSDIKPGEHWEHRPGAIIAQSDTVVFVSEVVKSERCILVSPNVV
jgi:hypothetical protein